ncbi:unnamed protein product [Musa hybrid cultivar]
MRLPVSDPPPPPPSSLRGGDDNAPLFKGSGMTRRGASAAVSYMACAVLLVLFNKAALSSYNFPCANVITLFQMISSTCILYAMRRWRIISFTNGEPHKGSFVPLETIFHTLPLSIAYLLYMLATMESVRGVNVPMYTTLRRTTVMFTMIVEYLLTRQKYTHPVVGSVALIVLGAFVAGARDLSFDAYGYGMVFIANMTTAIYLATINRVGRKSSGLNSFGLMWCNGIVCGPILLFWTYIRGDLELTMNFPYLHSLGFQADFFVIHLCCDDIFLHIGIFLELLHFLEHNLELCTDTDNVWQSEGSIYRWTRLVVVRGTSFRCVEYYRPSSWFRGLRFLRILQDQGEVAFHQLNLVNAKPLIAPIQMDSQRSNEIHITAARVPLTVHIKFWLHLFNFLCMISTPSDTIDILCFRNRTLDIEDIIIYVGSLYGLLSCKLSIVCDSNKI